MTATEEQPTRGTPICEEEKKGLNDQDRLETGLLGQRDVLLSYLASIIAVSLCVQLEP